MVATLGRRNLTSLGDRLVNMKRNVAAEGVFDLSMSSGHSRPVWIQRFSLLTFTDLANGNAARRRD
jgi:hypothetical protein